MHTHSTGDRVVSGLAARAMPEPVGTGPVEMPQGLDHRRHPDNLNETKAKTHDPDVLMCKLSLTHDDGKRPRAKHGAFGHGFNPFM